MKPINLKKCHCYWEGGQPNPKAWFNGKPYRKGSDCLGGTFFPLPWESLKLRNHHHKRTTTLNRFPRNVKDRVPWYPSQQMLVTERLATEFSRASHHNSHYNWQCWVPNCSTGQISPDIVIINNNNQQKQQQQQPLQPTSQPASQTNKQWTNGGISSIFQAPPRNVSLFESASFANAFVEVQFEGDGLAGRKFNT